VRACSSSTARADHKTRQGAEDRSSSRRGGRPRAPGDVRRCRPDASLHSRRAGTRPADRHGGHRGPAIARVRARRRQPAAKVDDRSPSRGTRDQRTAASLPRAARRVAAWPTSTAVCLAVTLGGTNPRGPLVCRRAQRPMPRGHRCRRSIGPRRPATPWGSRRRHGHAAGPRSRPARLLTPVPAAPPHQSYRLSTLRADNRSVTDVGLSPPGVVLAELSALAPLYLPAATAAGRPVILGRETLGFQEESVHIRRVGARAFHRVPAP
jgi:hypothetical protein